MKGAGLS